MIVRALIVALRRLSVLLLAAAFIILAVPLLMRALVDRYTYQDPSGAPQADAALVLGASVYEGQPSPVLEARAQAAVDLYLMGKVKKILVTGDNGALSHDEVTPVRKFLLAAGVAPEDIFLDHAGFDTYSSMYRARAVFDAKSVVITTQAYHLPRALFIARSLGLDASGVVAANHGVSLFDYVREIPASWKAIIDLVVRRQPKYLGAPIPLSGDGQSTWY
jgi:SanA protein